MYIEYLEAIVRPIVTYPDQVSVNETDDQLGKLLTLSVAAADMGLVIGREGVTSNAIRLLVRNLGLKNKIKLSLKIEEPKR